LKQKARVIKQREQEEQEEEEEERLKSVEATLIRQMHAHLETIGIAPLATFLKKGTRKKAGVDIDGADMAKVLRHSAIELIRSYPSLFHIVDSRWVEPTGKPWESPNRPEAPEVELKGKVKERFLPEHQPDVEEEEEGDEEGMNLDRAAEKKKKLSKAKRGAPVRRRAQAKRGAPAKRGAGRGTSKKAPRRNAKKSSRKKSSQKAKPRAAKPKAPKAVGPPKESAPKKESASKASAKTPQKESASKAPAKTPAANKGSPAAPAVPPAAGAARRGRSATRR
jgi:hypothetical protein